MKVNITISVVFSLVAVFCTGIGYSLGALESKKQEKLVSEEISRQVEAIERAIDGNMYGAEPYNSYRFSFILYEATLEEGSVSIIQEILLKELDSRAEVVREYCKTRAHSGFRVSCEELVNKAKSYAGGKNS